MQKKRKKKFIVLVSAIVFIVSCVISTVSFAAWSAETITEQNVETGAVEARIIEVFEQNPTIYPGDQVEKIVNVKNTGRNEIYVRLKITPVWDGEGSLSADNILFATDDDCWFDGHDGYYYYKYILKPNETTKKPIIESFTLDSDTDNRYKGKDANIFVDMDAVQATGEAVSVWGKSYQDFEEEPDAIVAGSASTVLFTSPNDGFIYSEDIVLFQDILGMTPNEEREQAAVVKNDHDVPVEIYIKTDFDHADTSTDEDKELIGDLLTSHIALDVSDDNGGVYHEGPLFDAGEYSVLEAYTSLGVFQPQETKTLTMRLSMSAVPGNEYQNLQGKMFWALSTGGPKADVTPAPTPEVTHDPLPPPLAAEQTPEPSDDPEATVTPSAEPTPTPEPVIASIDDGKYGGGAQTGQDGLPPDVLLGMGIAFAVIAAVSFAFLLWNYRKRLRDDFAGEIKVH